MSKGWSMGIGAMGKLPCIIDGCIMCGGCVPIIIESFLRFRIFPDRFICFALEECGLFALR